MDSHKHVVPRENGWAVKKEHGKKASRNFESKEQAVDYAMETAKNQGVCVVVHDHKGKFKEFDCEPEVKRNQ